MPPKKIPSKKPKKITNQPSKNKLPDEDEIQIQLNTECILNVPLQNYGDDFTFIVNKKEFKTKSLISDLLSTKICKIHSADPTFNQFEITTKNQGDFSHILNLTRFGSVPLPEKEIPFIAEVSEALGLNSISSKNLHLSFKLNYIPATLKNISILYLRTFTQFVKQTSNN